MAAETDHPLERLIFFSDAVFAIAITLLVIEIHPPHLPHGAANDAHLQALAQLIPQFAGYFVSFWVIAMFWMGHHRSFALAQSYSGRVLPWNLGLLFVIAFMPFMSAYLSSNLNEPVPTRAYCVAMLVAAFFNFQANRIATSPPMLRAGVAPEAVRYIRLRSIAVMLGSATAVIVALIAPFWGLYGLISIPIWLRLLAAFFARKPAPAAADA